MHHQTLQSQVSIATVVLLGAVLSTASGCASNRVEFGSPQDAADALIAALSPERDAEALREIFGSNGYTIISSGDDVDDQQNASRFVAAYSERHGFEKADDGYTYLVIGDDEWPFAIPLEERSGGWSFDTDAGIDELLNRRIGQNELDTIQVCLAIADAQLEYARLDHDADGIREYARKFRSSWGEHDGLYWPAKTGDPLSPLGELAADAAEGGYDLDHPARRGEGVYNGYRFRILDSQGEDARGGSFDYVIDGLMVGGFAVVAWPATYGNSGIMTFIVNHNGIVYEKDHGRRTDRIARNLNRFNPDPSWDQVNEKPFAD